MENTENSCQYREGCPMFKIFNLDASKELFKNMYCCNERHTRCERFKLRTAGLEIPNNLLPNGKYLTLRNI